MRQALSRLNLQPRYDVVILGGGPAGLAAAISLRKHAKLSVLIAEAQVPHQERIGESCPPDIILLLEQLGLAAQFRQGGHDTCPGYASVWGRAQVGYNDFIVNPMGPAWRLNRRVFDDMLVQAAVAQGAEVAWSVRFVNAQSEPADRGGYRLHLVHANDRQLQGADDADTECVVHAKYVIDATGAHARFARSRGVTQRIDDRLYAFVRFSQVRSGEITRQVLLEAAPDGWWYAARLPDDRVVSMMVTERETLPLLQRGHQQGYQEALESTSLIGPALASLSLADARFYTWPIYSGFLPQAEGQDWMAIGDAASSFDPLAAQGIYKALADGLAAGRRVADYLENGVRSDNAHTEQVRRRYADYQKNRAYVYALEQRWAHAPFWRNRRHTAPQVWPW